KETADANKRIENIMNQMTIEEKIDMIGGYNRFSIRPNERLSIPEIKMTDGPLGVRNINGEATAFPASIALAASWDRELVEKVGAAIAQEARAKGKHILLAPGMNIYRAPMTGRNFEYLGEDPYLSGEMAVSYIIGVQKEGVVATAKHFVANNQEYDRHHTSSDMDERTLREIYLPAFKACVQKGNVGAVMTAYNPINGIHASQHDYLINKVLKEEWSFDGFVMSDWTSTYDGIAAANAGLDLEMPDAKYMNRDTLLPAIESGKLKEEVIDDKIRRILRVYERFGFLDDNVQRGSEEINWESNKLTALEAARGSVVMLKNEDEILPLENIKSIAVLGPNGHPAIYRGGGSSEVNPKRTISVFEGLKELAEGVKVEYESGSVIKLTKDISEQSEFYTYKNGQKVKGLTGKYYANMNMEGDPAFTRIDSHVFFHWTDPIQEGFPEDFFSVCWTGKIKVKESGQYTFMVSGDDGFRLFFDNKIVLDEWRDQSETQKNVILDLVARKEYDVLLEYYENQGGAAVSFGCRKLENTFAAELLAKKSNVAIVCVGFNEHNEGESRDR
ncbi:glycoside hydrolase family 3 C-terminal domain-containing protein, partial [bacterium]|nr:glycoside hydrolase family 3 C-terminal domain-containing protein [bacterium]